MKYITHDEIKGTGVFLTISRTNWWWPFRSVQEKWFHNYSQARTETFFEIYNHNLWVRGDGKKASPKLSDLLDNLLLMSRAEAIHFKQITTDIDNYANVVSFKSSIKSG